MPHPSTSNTQLTAIGDSETAKILRAHSHAIHVNRTEHYFVTITITGAVAHDVPIWVQHDVPRDTDPVVHLFTSDKNTHKEIDVGVQCDDTVWAVGVNGQINIINVTRQAAPVAP